MQGEAIELHNRMWGIRPDKKYSPAPLPVSLSTSDLATIRDGEYMYAEKNHGERRTLFLGAVTTSPDEFREFAYLFDRAMSAQPLRVSVDVGRLPVSICNKRPKHPLDVFSGTMLDGELVVDHQGGKATYIVFDAFFVCGYDIRKKSFPQRISEARAVVAAVSIDFVFAAGAEGAGGAGGAEGGDSGNILLETKVWHSLDTGMPFQSLLDKPHQDGLIFMPMYKPISIGRNALIFKWKPRSQATIDVLWSNGDLWWGIGAELEQCAGVWPKEWSINLKKELATRESGVYELTPCFGESDELSGFTVHDRRHDKEAPNQRVTIQKTVDNIHENIQAHTLETNLRSNRRSKQISKKISGTN